MFNLLNYGRGSWCKFTQMFNLRNWGACICFELQYEYQLWRQGWYNLSVVGLVAGDVLARGFIEIIRWTQIKLKSSPEMYWEELKIKKKSFTASSDHSYVPFSLRCALLIEVKWTPSSSPRRHLNQILKGFRLVPLKLSAKHFSLFIDLMWIETNTIMKNVVKITL